MRRLLVLAIVLLAAPADAGVALAWPTSAQALTLTPQAEIPVQLATGPQGTSTLNQNSTGLRTTVSASLVGASYNVSKVETKTSSAWRVRLVQDTWTGSTTRCTDCRIALEKGGVSETQIVVTNGVVTQTQGAWMSLAGVGQAGSATHIHVTATTNGLGGQLAVLGYRLETQPDGSASPRAVYSNMTLRIEV